jgi:hypothetical protein
MRPEHGALIATRYNHFAKTLSVVYKGGNMEKVTCDWAKATDADKKEFPDSVAYHQKHGANMAECDAWVCPCGNSTDTGGFRPCDANGDEVEPPDAGSTDILRFACNDCGRIILHSTGEVVGRNPNGTLL